MGWEEKRWMRERGRPATGSERGNLLTPSHRDPPPPGHLAVTSPGQVGQRSVTDPPPRAVTWLTHAWDSQGQPPIHGATSINLAREGASVWGPVYLKDPSPLLR